MATKTRREFLLAGTATGGGLMLAMLPKAGAAADKSPAIQKKCAQARGRSFAGRGSDAQDGALRRIFSIYAEARKRLYANQELPPKALADSAGIVRSFVEDYHEKLEEEFLFPRFKKANKLVELVTVLFEQHQAGRRLTDTVLRLATPQSLKRADDRKTLVESLHWFLRMYEPHAAREDTVLFPAFHDLVSPREYDRLGEEFEKKEQKLFGTDGFERVVEQIATIEKSLGIYDLGQFTPRV